MTAPLKQALGESEAYEMRRVLMEIALRKIEGLKLYRPMPKQAEFHASMAKERIIRSGNRGGKSLCAAAEVAYAVTNQDPLKRYPEKQIWYLVGKDLRVVGQVMYKLLFKPGAFKIIRDAKTGEWRTYNENDPLDKGRKDQCRPAPALIPRRFVQDISWENKKDSAPRIVFLNNGNELHFFTANGLPPQGTSITGSWMTEEIPQRYWYPEISARLLDQHGWFIWDATPQEGTEQFYHLHERAQEQIEKNILPRTVEEFELSSEANVHLDKHAMDAFKDKLEDEDYDIRVSGEFVLMSFRVYPEYKPSIHEISMSDIPSHWTCYSAIDPGRQVCGVLFLAVPPPEEGEEVYLYDELYIKACSAELFGERMKEKTYQRNFRTFLIDWQEAHKFDTGSGKQIGEQYADALRRRGIKCETSGSEFIPADNNPRAGIEAFRAWLLPGPRGMPKLRVVAEKCPMFKWEVKHYHYKRVRGVVTDEPVKKNDHLMDCARYLAQHRPTWVPPKKIKGISSAAYKSFLRKLEIVGKRDGSNPIIFGPGGM